MNNKQKLYIEYDKEYFCGRIIASKIREATKKEIKDAELSYKKPVRLYPKYVTTRAVGCITKDIVGLLTN